MLAAIAQRHKIPVFISNQVGGNDSLIFDGSSFGVWLPTAHCSPRPHPFAKTS
jgi:NAD+ synthase (glutamine-hydrolysing)